MFQKSVNGPITDQESLKKVDYSYIKCYFYIDELEKIFFAMTVDLFFV